MIDPDTESLIKSLRQLAAYEHFDVSIATEAADLITILVETLEMNSTSDSKPSCFDCRYYRRDHCEWARANFAPAWVNESQVVSPDTGAECDCWEQDNA